MTDFNKYIESYEKCVQKYIPPKNTWNPADEALYKPRDLFRIPLKEAEEMQFKSIKYAFKHHYENNSFYNNFCKENNIEPNDIKNLDDLDKIPLIPDKFFKDYPSGKDFATWLGNIFTGDLPKIVINRNNPSYDDVIESLSNFEIDKIAAKAEKMYPLVTKTASAEARQVHAGTAIVLEAKEQETKDQDMATRLGQLFTLNGKQTVAEFDKLMEN